MFAFPRLMFATLLACATLLSSCGDRSQAVAPPHVVSEVVTYSHDGVRLEGYLAYDDSITKRRPGILIVHE
ncbi:MAG: hypothetical protein O2894_08455 [Planctomycetota bacterium]|nr:hypothetical protein [Planctomycetota bacterium]